MTPKIRVDYGRMLDVLGIEGRLLAAAAHDAPPDAAVPGASSGRTVRDVVGNVGALCENALSWLGATEAAAREWGLPGEAGLSVATSRFTARLADLLAEFGTRSVDEPCLTWWPEDHSVGFWLRRMVFATTLHRVDVQSAACAPVTPIASDIALDGIDEVLRAWFGHRLRALGIRAARASSVLVCAENRRWMVTTEATDVSVVRLGDTEVSTADSVIQGEAQAVFLWLWGRLPDRAIRSSGDLDAVAQLWGLLRLATQ